MPYVKMEISWHVSGTAWQKQRESVGRAQETLPEKQQEVRRQCLEDSAQALALRMSKQMRREKNLCQNKAKCGPYKNGKI